jgi:hypothetical protein
LGDLPATASGGGNGNNGKGRQESQHDRHANFFGPVAASLDA